MHCMRSSLLFLTLHRLQRWCNPKLLLDAGAAEKRKTISLASCLGTCWFSTRSRAGRVVVVGDVHGCSDELKDLLEASQFHPSLDELVFVGDLIGKGPSPEEVVRIARKYSAKAVQGNHEYNLLQWRKRGGILPDPEGRIKERYAATVKGLEEDEWDWLESLPLKLQLDLPQSPLPVMVVHAGLVPGVSIEQQEPENLVNLRRASKQYDAGGGGWARHWRGPMQVIFGHDARRGLQREPFAIGLDTGAVYGDELTALLLPKNLDRSLAHLEPQHFAQVRARRAYAQKSDDLKSTQ
ncbi:unnamed protein product [Durusdinium trenchii]|uniref:Calcineurin-like phosphoesterase domain-containing protein n=1 Tax=Durusdinium trenchii TaxID=1381693 RepID=A0ABP0RNC2_9DINO